MSERVMCPFCLNTAEHIKLPKAHKEEVKCEDCGSILIRDSFPQGYELIRTWKEDPYELRMYDMFKRDHFGKWRISYEFECGGRLIFKGDGYYCSPSHAIDSDSSVVGLLSFLSLRPGDTYEDYFKDYTELQLDFANEHGENLAFQSMQLEEDRHLDQE